MSEDVTITGLKEIEIAMYAFGNKLGDKVAKSALRVGANYIVKQVRAAAPKKTGRLRRAIRVSNSRINNGRNGLLGVYINIRKSIQSGAFYGRFQEDGYKAVGRRRGGSGRDIPGKKFIKNTFNQNQTAAVQLIVQAAERGTRILAERLGFHT